MTQILNEDIAVLPILIGNRLLDRRDFEAFFEFFRPKKGYHPLCHDYLGEGFDNFKEIIDRSQNLVEKIISSQEGPLAVFLILTRTAAEEVELVNWFVEQVSQKRKNVFIYPLVWDISMNEHFFYGGENNFHLYEKGRVAYIYFHPDAQTAGGRRVTEFIKRIMGYDLVGQFFPDYPREIIQKIAKQINRENFNTWSRRRDSIPKYPIRGGKPYFPVLEVEKICGQCGKNIIIDRKDIGINGKIERSCPYCSRVIHISDIQSSFDLWPEFDEYQKSEFAMEV